MNFDVFNYPYARNILQKLLVVDKYKRILPPDYIKNKYYVDNKYAFLLAVDAIIKYDQIIEEPKYLHLYINQLIKIFDKYSNYNDIKNGINLLIAKITCDKLCITNIHTFSAREMILRYIYNKYIVNGYFYFGFSSNYLNEIECVGIRTNTFFIDDKLNYINDVFKKASGKLLFLNEKTTITDDITIATYFSLISPYFLADMASNPLFIDKKINRECFYRHDLVNIKESLGKVCDFQRIDPENKKEVVNSFIDCYTLSCAREIKPCIAKINRRSINKNKLKDIDRIIKDTDEKLGSAVGLILDSRYTSYNIIKDISPYDIEIIQIPTYCDLLTGPNSITNVINVNSEELKIDNSIIRRKITQNSFGSISLAYIGLLFIFIGTVLAIFMSFMGG